MNLNNSAAHVHSIFKTNTMNHDCIDAFPKYIRNSNIVSIFDICMCNILQFSIHCARQKSIFPKDLSLDRTDILCICICNIIIKNQREHLSNIQHNFDYEYPGSLKGCLSTVYLYIYYCYYYYATLSRDECWRCIHFIIHLTEETLRSLVVKVWFRHRCYGNKHTQMQIIEMDSEKKTPSFRFEPIPFDKFKIQYDLLTVIPDNEWIHSEF